MSQSKRSPQVSEESLYHSFPSLQRQQNQQPQGPQKSLVALLRQQYQPQQLQQQQQQGQQQQDHQVVSLKDKIGLLAQVLNRIRLTQVDIDSNKIGLMSFLGAVLFVWIIVEIVTLLKTGRSPTTWLSEDVLTILFLAIALILLQLTGGDTLFTAIWWSTFLVFMPLVVLRMFVSLRPPRKRVCAFTAEIPDCDEETNIYLTTLPGSSEAVAYYSCNNHKSILKHSTESLAVGMFFGQTWTRVMATHAGAKSKEESGTLIAPPPAPDGGSCPSFTFSMDSMVIEGRPIENLAMQYHAPQIILDPGMELRKEKQTIGIISKIPIMFLGAQDFGAPVAGMIDQKLSAGGKAVPKIFYEHTLTGSRRFDGSASVIVSYISLFGESHSIALAIDRKCSVGQLSDISEPPKLIPEHTLSCRERGHGWVDELKGKVLDMVRIHDEDGALLPNEMMCDTCKELQNMPTKFIHSYCRSQLVPVLQAQLGECQPKPAVAHASGAITCGLDSDIKPFAKGTMCCVLKQVVPPQSLAPVDYDVEIRPPQCESVFPCPSASMGSSELCV
eukprot:c10912_g1_i1.p1 GENE.c10912_g1_i1~~c10912_g1_i1.p1  ORF type:complete len:557 (+),score=114.39 c10912_g1_i1:651-2321(+)